MKAVVFREYGPADVLQLAEIEKPEPAQDEVLIRVHAAEVTKGDCEIRGFRFAVKWFWLPLRIALGVRRPKNPVLGGYFSGVVEAVGEHVSRFRPGDPVFGHTGLRFGAYGEYVCLPASYTIVPKPANLGFAEAAAVPLGGLNALHFLRRANIHEGDQVLINGAGGSIGIFAVQIARALGAEVSCVDRGDKKDLLLRAGAQYFFDYTREDFTRSGRRYDVIFNMVANAPYAAHIRLLKPNGRYLLGNPRLSGMLRSVFTGLFSSKRTLVAFAAETEAELRTLKSMIENGEIAPIIDRIYAPAQAAEAHRRVETEQRQGMVVISMEAAPGQARAAAR